MLTEPSNRSEEYHATVPVVVTADLDQPRLAEFAGLRETIEEIMMIQQVEYPDMPQIVAQFIGKLTVPSAEAYELAEPTFIRMEVYAFFAENEQGDHLITVVAGRKEVKPRPWWPNLALLILTIMSLIYVGSEIQAGVDNRDVQDFADLQIWKGWPYALSMILILGAHELGHYFAARYYKVSVTLPYFIPMPLTFFGTLGAFIQLREPMKNRRALFDVGAAGPLAGLVFAVPILFLGLSTAKVSKLPTDESYAIEGNSIFYSVAKLAVFGRFLPDEEQNEDVFINQLAQAGWTGLLVTALNLIPLGQLDGGHVIYSVFGRRARHLFWPIVIFFTYLTIFVNQGWILWTLLLVPVGLVHARPLEDITPLDTKRRMIGYITLFIFVMIFVPNPLRIITV